MPGRRNCMKTIILSLLICFAAQATITRVQQVTSGNSCSGSSGTSCAVTVAATGSGHILIAMFALHGAGTTVTAVSDSTGETWVHATSCYATSGSEDVDCWYVLSSTSGATTITATLNASGNGRTMFFYEFSVGAGCFGKYDRSGSANDSTSRT